MLAQEPEHHELRHYIDVLNARINVLALGQRQAARQQQLAVRLVRAWVVPGLRLVYLWCFLVGGHGGAGAVGGAGPWAHSCGAEAALPPNAASAHAATTHHMHTFPDLHTCTPLHTPIPHPQAGEAPAASLQLAGFSREPPERRGKAVGGAHGCRGLACFILCGVTGSLGTGMGRSGVGSGFRWLPGMWAHHDQGPRHPCLLMFNIHRAGELVWAWHPRSTLHSWPSRWVVCYGGACWKPALTRWSGSAWAGKALAWRVGAVVGAGVWVCACSCSAQVGTPGAMQPGG